jgi:peroxiredoxin
MKRFQAMAGTLILAGLTMTQASAAGALAVGSRAPDFAIKLDNGLSGHLSDLKGSVVVLDFWASWCPWCMKELPEVNAIGQKYDKTIVIGIDSEDAVTIAKASADMKLRFHTMPDADEAIGASYGVDAFPKVVVIDAQGKVAAVVEGYHADNTLEKAVTGAMGR